MLPQVPHPAHLAGDVRALAGRRGAGATGVPTPPCRDEDASPQPCRSGTEIDVLVVQLEPLVEAAQPIEVRTADEQEGTRDLVDVNRTVSQRFHRVCT